jgi:acylphosphatase
MAKSRVHVLVEGRVQGVFFRYETRKQARERDVTGWVKNLYDGRVEAVFEGEEEDVGQVVNWCSIGPPGAWVKRVETRKENYQEEFKEFSIAY